ncbi:glycosyltransferase 87 family protein [Alloacidobacterium sp.]|uniref:glycosyltransferase 87 family protein n=1 Tax=Alloacidobacterium sp. TaxID=2951999 RepID=UPI002D34A41E|nr:glycosyltransferase 87 family protein [Alloacidobacterium sp.]HYK34867.1 glycosyltransferase 87 family protein [Alloacidobacterium sp.]
MKSVPDRFQAIIATKAWLGFEWGCLVLLALLLLGRGILPGWHRLNFDFPNDYVVARLLRGGYSLDHVYDWVWLQRIKDHWGLDVPLVDYAGQPPLSALPLLPVAGFGALTAKRIWIVANFFFLFGAAEAMHRATQLGRRRVWLLILLAVIPLRASFLLGQFHILVLFLLALAYLFRSRSRSVACGICIALAGGLKVYPLTFAVYFAWKKQWRELISIVVATAALVGISYAWVGGHVMHMYLTQVLPRSMQGEVIDPYNVRSSSAVAFLHRLFLFEPGLNPVPVWNRPLLYSIIFPLWQAAVLFPLFLSIRPSLCDRDAEKLEWAVFLFALLLLSPQPSSYHFAVMILPIVLAADVLLKKQQCSQIALMILLYAFMFRVAVSPDKASNGFSFLTVLAFSRLWIGLLLWVFFVICLWRENTLHEDSGNMRLRAGLLFAAVCIFWILGFAGYQRHFAHREDDLRARLPLPIHPLLTTGIHPRAGGFVATAMLLTNYQIINQNGKAPWPGNPDQLSSAVTDDGSKVFIELADKNGSRIVLQDSSDFEIPNAESPAISADGSSLVYIRETKGRGSLRMASLMSSSGVITVARDTELVDPPYDVRDAAFAPSGYIAFAARINSKTNIYRLTPGGQPTILISGQDEVDSPAAAPDGQRLVFRKLVRNRWQLMMMDLTSHQERQLTFGDCNAFAPAWINDSTIAYATDCERAMWLPALAGTNVGAR